MGCTIAKAELNKKNHLWGKRAFFFSHLSSKLKPITSKKRGWHIRLRTRKRAIGQALLFGTFYKSGAKSMLASSFGSLNGLFPITYEAFFLSEVHF